MWLKLIDQILGPNGWGYNQSPDCTKPLYTVSLIARCLLQCRIGCSLHSHAICTSWCLLAQVDIRYQGALRYCSLLPYKALVASVAISWTSSSWSALDRHFIGQEECQRLQQRKVTAVASKVRIQHFWSVACLASRRLKGRWAPLPQCPADFQLIFNPLRRRAWPGAVTVILHHVSHDSHLNLSWPVYLHIMYLYNLWRRERTS